MSEILNTETTFKEGMKDLIVKALENGGCGMAFNDSTLVLEDGTKVVFNVVIEVTSIEAEGG